MADIERSPWNRCHFTEDKLAELAASVKEHGVRTPLQVRPHPAKPGKYEIVAGERRWLASKRAGLAEVPCLVESMSDEQALELQAIENLQREDLNHVEEGEKYQQLLECYKKAGLTDSAAVEKLCEKVGRSKSGVYERLRLLKLPDVAKEAVLDGRMAGATAALIAKLEKRPDLAAAVAARVMKPAKDEATDNGVLTYRDTRHLVDRALERAEADAEYNRVRDQFLKRGDLILDDDESAKVFPHQGSDHVGDGCGYVETKTWCNEGGLYQEWGKLMGRHAKTTSRVLARAPSGRPVILHPKTEARAAALKNGTKFTRQVSNPGAARERAEAARRKRENAARHEAMAALVAKMEAPHNVSSKMLWETVCFALADHYMHADSCQAVAKRRGLNVKDKYNQVKGHARTLQTERELQAYAIELLVGGGFYCYPDVLKRASLLFGVQAPPPWKVSR